MKSLTDEQIELLLQQKRKELDCEKVINRGEERLFSFKNFTSSTSSSSIGSSEKQNQILRQEQEQPEKRKSVDLNLWVLAVRKYIDDGEFKKYHIDDKLVESIKNMFVFLREKYKDLVCPSYKFMQNFCKSQNLNYKIEDIKKVIAAFRTLKLMSVHGRVDIKTNRRTSNQYFFWVPKIIWFQIVSLSKKTFQAVINNKTVAKITQAVMKEHIYEGNRFERRPDGKGNFPTFDKKYNCFLVQST